MRSPYFLSFILSLGLLFSCEDEDVQLLTETAVVEAYLVAGQPLDSVKIQQSIAYSGNSEEIVV